MQVQVINYYSSEGVYLLKDEAGKTEQYKLENVHGQMTMNQKINITEPEVLEADNAGEPLVYSAYITSSYEIEG